MQKGPRKQSRGPFSFFKSSRIFFWCYLSLRHLFVVSSRAKPRDPGSFSAPVAAPRLRRYRSALRVMASAAKDLAGQRFSRQHLRSLHGWSAVVRFEKDPGSLGFARDDTKIISSGEPIPVARIFANRGLLFHCGQLAVVDLHHVLAHHLRARG